MYKLVAILSLVVAVHCGTYGSRYEMTPEVKVASTYDTTPVVTNVPLIPIVRAEVNNDNVGNYDFKFESANGIRQVESGSLTVVGPEESLQVKTGQVAWTSPEGKTFALTYTADENGFRVQGDHLPTPPPTPEAILKALEVIRVAEANAAAEESNVKTEIIKTGY